MHKTFAFLIAVSLFVVSCLPTETPTPTISPLPTEPSPLPTVPPVMGPVDPDVLGECPASVHDLYITVGPDGNTYRTWHPVEVPLSEGPPGVPSCRFAHEHGMDPSTSIANSAPPIFGYESVAAGILIEAHQGFKVFVVNAGTRNDEGRVANHSSRIVAHMGTGGPLRFNVQFHSLQVDMVSGDSSDRYIHVHGMADTRASGNICERSGGEIGRTVVTIKNEGCVIQSLYEIWEFTLRLRDRATVIISTAVFDPITVKDSSDISRLVYTHTEYPEFGSFPKHGCDAESYHGPYRSSNAGRSTVFTTDAYGQSGDAISQVVSPHTYVELPMSSDGQTQFKLRASQCVSGLGLKN